MSPEFEVHMLNADGKHKANLIALEFDLCLRNLQKHCPDGRYLSIVKTKLEEACFFAKKSMANLPENQERKP